MPHRYLGPHLTVAPLLVFSVPAVGQSFSCRPAGDEYTASLRAYVVELVTAPAADTLLTNTRLQYGLPAGSETSVSVETRRQRCTAAGQAYHLALHPGTPQVSRNVVVIKVGSARYVVMDPQERAGEFGVYVVFDGTWNVLAVFNG